MNFKNRVVLITGSGRGLGFAYATAIADLGATVLIQDAGRDSEGLGHDPNVARAAASALREKGLNAQAVSGHIQTRADCHELISEAFSLFGRIDAIIHNAGWVEYEEIESIAEDSLERMLNIGVKAPIWLAQAAWPFMLDAGYGRIVLTTSDRALYPEYVHDGLAAYAAAKFGAVGLANVLASEGAPHDIVVNCISPVAKTRMWGITEEPKDLRPDQVAPGVVFLASDACVEGGWILRASNGQFHAVKSCEAAGVDYPTNLQAVSARTAQEVAASWPRIAVKTIEPRAAKQRPSEAEKREACEQA